jgi:subtilisin family serine protease
MAAPVVTGTVALWLQADPTLTPKRIKEVIAATAKHPDPTLTYPNTIYGSGEIDAYAGLLKILNITSVTNLSTRQADIALEGRTLRINGADVASVTVYSLTGQVMPQTTTTDGVVQLPQLPSAVYAVQVNAGGRQLGSTLIRL